MAIMRKKIAFALRRLVTVSNLLESLNDAYGYGRAMLLPAPLGYGKFNGESLTYGQCVSFTNLVCEALIRRLDMKKGERVLIISPSGAELLLLALAVIKGGGIAVPLDHRLPLRELRNRAEGCGAGPALIDGGVAARREDILDIPPRAGRVMICGPGRKTPRGFLSLREALEEGSGFFLPYTLKPGSVVGLFHSSGEEGSSLAVMATNRMILGARRVASSLLPGGPGDAFVSALPLTSLVGFSCALMGLCAGMALFTPPGGGRSDVLGALEGSGAVVLMGDARLFRELLLEDVASRGLSSLRLWLSAGGATGELVASLRSRGEQGMAPFRLAPPFAEIFTLAESTGALALKLALPWVGWPERWPGVVIPPNRLKVVDGSGRKVKRGEEGCLAVKGPAVTPGYWNNMEYTLESMREGWLHSGVRARRGRFFPAVLAGNGPARNGGHGRVRAAE